MTVRRPARGCPRLRDSVSRARPVVPDCTGRLALPVRRYVQRRIGRLPLGLSAARRSGAAPPQPRFAERRDGPEADPMQRACDGAPCAATFGRAIERSRAHPTARLGMLR